MLLSPVLNFSRLCHTSEEEVRIIFKVPKKSPSLSRLSLEISKRSDITTDKVKISAYTLTHYITPKESLRKIVPRKNSKTRNRP